MRRRNFFALLGRGVARSGIILLALLVAPIASGLAIDPLKRIGVLASVSCPGSGNTPAFKVFLARLAELGWIEGQTVVIDCVNALGRFDQAPALAAELVARRPD